MATTRAGCCSTPDKVLKESEVEQHYFVMKRTDCLAQISFNMLRTGSIARIDEYIRDRIPLGSVTDLEELYAEREVWSVPTDWE